MKPHPLESYFPAPLTSTPDRNREPRSQRLVVLITAAERVQFQARASERNLSMASLVRGFLLGLSPPQLDLTAVAALHHLQNAIWATYEAVSEGSSMDDEFEGLVREVRSLYQELLLRLEGAP